MSPVEIVKDTIDALKGNPLLLGLLIINVLFGAAGLLYLRREQAQMDRMIELIAACH